MQHQLTPYSTGIESFAWWENAFTEEELNWLQHNARQATQQAQVGGNPDKDSLAQIRRSQVSWLSKNTETAWVFEKLANVVSALNSQCFRFDLTGFGEPMQLTNYSSSNKGTYGWHQDYGQKNKASRKLSIVLQLSDPNEYEGGNLQLLTSGTATNIKKQRGLVVAFPSYILHQVTPVTQGQRQSLVTWVSGPEFK